MDLMARSKDCAVGQDRWRDRQGAWLLHHPGPQRLPLRHQAGQEGQHNLGRALNTDRIDRLSIETKKWPHCPMPRKETCIHALEVDDETGDIWTTYSNLPVGKRDPKIYGTESANNSVIRPHPGD